MTGPGRLLLLGLRLAVARWKLAWRRRYGPAGLVLGGAGSLLAWLLLVAGAVAFAGVGTTLVAALAGRGETELAAAVAGAVADAAAVLGVLAVAAADEGHRGIPPRPLLVLPVGAGERVGAEALSLLSVEPLAAVAWPAALVLVLGGGQVSPRVALLLAVPAAGLLLFVAALGLFVRHVVLGAPRAGLAPALLGTGLAFAVPVAWLLGNGRGTLGLLRIDGGPWTPGWWIGRSFREAMAGRPAALLPGGILLLVAFGLLVLAARAADHPRLSRPRPPRAGPRLLPLAAATWSPRPLLARWTGNGAAAFLLLLAGHVLVHRGFPWPGLPRAVALLAGLVAAGAPAPVLANLLGARHPGVLGLLLAGARPGALLARLAVAAAAPAALLFPLVGAAAWWLLPGPGPVLAFGAGALGALGLGIGTGLLLSLAWPVPLRPDEPGTTLWPPGPGRWIMTAAQGLALLPFFRGPVAVAGLVSVGAGSLAALGGWFLARKGLRERALQVTESLLT